MYQHIFVPVDGSPGSDAAVGQAIDIARCTGARLHFFKQIDDHAVVAALRSSPMMDADWHGVLHAEAQRVVSAAEERAAAEGLACDGWSLEDYVTPVASRIVSEATRVGADLIVIGTRGDDGVRRVLIGGIAERVVREAGAPVLVVHAASSHGDDAVPAQEQTSGATTSHDAR